MSFSAFIRKNLDAIVDEWESFAKTLPIAPTMSSSALRDHCREILLAVATDMETRETDGERSTKSKGNALSVDGSDTAATEHGALRHLSGFDLTQLVAEFRALRASVLALWKRRVAALDSEVAIEEITRFNESIDQALAASVESYSSAVATSRDMFLAVLGHDLRSPLSAISATGQILLLQREMSDQSRKEAALRIQRASITMELLIVDLLEFTRTRLGAGIPIERAECDLRAVCTAALETVRTGQPGYTFEEHYSGDLKLSADARRLQQALLNLLSNAAQHGDRRRHDLTRRTGG